jgi:hypothetical protein
MVAALLAGEPFSMNAPSCALVHVPVAVTFVSTHCHRVGFLPVDHRLEYDIPLSQNINALTHLVGCTSKRMVNNLNTSRRTFDRRKRLAMLI